MERTWKNNSLTEGSVCGTLLRFFFPVLFGTLFQRFYNTVDSIIVGQFIGPAALASVGGSASLIIKLIVNFFSGLASGASIVTAQYYGAEEYKKLRQTAGTGVFFCLSAGAVLTVMGVIFAPVFLGWTDEPLEIMAESTAYLRVYFAGMIPQMVYNIGAGILRAVGDSKRPFYYLVVCCVLNILLDMLFVGVLHMGVTGAAWATVIAQTVSAALVMINLCVSQTPYRLRNIRPDGDSLKQILRFGIPAGLQSALFSMSKLIMQKSVNGLGATVVAAWSVTDKLDGVLSAVANAFGTSAAVFSGQTFGAGMYDRMKKGVGICLMMSVAITASLSALLLLLGEYGVRVFTGDAEVIRYAAQRLWSFVPFFVFWTVIDTLSGALRGAGDTAVPTVITAAGICGIRILWCLFIVPRYNTITGIGFSYPVSWFITAATYVVYWFAGGWVRRCVRKRDRTLAAS